MTNVNRQLSIFTHFMRFMRGCMLCGVCLLITACASTSQPPADLQPVYQAYHAGNHEQAYALARQLAATGGEKVALEAAYMAGMSAYQLGRPQQAEYYLSYAARSDNKELAADAKAGLGLVYLQQGRAQAAESTLRLAADKLTGQDRANAYFYAGLAQQRQGLWNQARASFTQARALSNDPAFREQCNQQLAFTGFTLQTGAYSNLQNAQRQARQLANQTQKAWLDQPRIVTATGGDGRRLYLVQVGQFSTYASALSARQRLGSSSAIITPMGATGR